MSRYEVKASDASHDSRSRLARTGLCPARAKKKYGLSVTDTEINIGNTGP